MMVLLIYAEIIIVYLFVYMNNLEDIIYAKDSIIINEMLMMMVSK